MRRTKEIQRLRHDLGLSVKAIGRSVGVSTSTVSKRFYRARSAGVTWPLPPELEDEAKLKALLYPRTPSAKRRPEPDMARIQTEMRKKGVTLQLLWQEYKGENPDGYQYTAFCIRYRKWEKGRDLALRQTYKAGERLLVDFAGVSVPITEADTGETWPGQIFVATLPASAMIFAEAVARQDEEGFVGAHAHAFDFFGGATAIIVPDNLKAGVVTPSPYEPILSTAYQEMARHYGCAIVPTRVREPRDKAAVEAAVQMVERQVLAPLRHRTFFSLTEANAAIRKLVAAVNAKPFQLREGSRQSFFGEVEKAALRPLPGTPYTFPRWKTARVHPDYHVQVEKALYSVPYTLVREEVDVRLTLAAVQIFHKGLRVATHPRLHRKGQVRTHPEHHPPLTRATSPGRRNASSGGRRTWAPRPTPSSGASWTTRTIPSRPTVRRWASWPFRGGTAPNALKKRVAAPWRWERSPTAASPPSCAWAWTACPSHLPPTVPPSSATTCGDRPTSAREETSMLINPTVDMLRGMRLPAMAQAYVDQKESPETQALGFDERFASIVDREFLARTRSSGLLRLPPGPLAADLLHQPP